MTIQWEPKALDVFNRVINSLPEFHKSIAQRLVKQRSEALAAQRGSDQVSMDDLLTAFFQEVPPAFKSMMQRLFKKLGVDYSSYITNEESPAESNSPS